MTWNLVQRFIEIKTFKKQPKWFVHCFELRWRKHIFKVITDIPKNQYFPSSIPRFYIFDLSVPIKCKIRLLKAQVLKIYRTFVIRKGYAVRVILPTSSQNRVRRNQLQQKKIPCLLAASLNLLCLTCKFNLSILRMLTSFVIAHLNAFLIQV